MPSSPGISTILLPVEMPGDEGIGLSRELVRLPQGLAASSSMVVQRLQEAWQGPVLRARQYGPRGFLHRPRPATSPPGAASPTAGSYSSLNSSGAGLLPAPPSDDESEDTLPTFCELCWREGHAERDCWGRCACHDPDEPYPIHSRPDPHE